MVYVLSSVVGPLLGAAAGLVVGREAVRGLKAAGAVLARLEEWRGRLGRLSADGSAVEHADREETADDRRGNDHDS